MKSKDYIQGMIVGILLTVTFMLITGFDKTQEVLLVKIVNGQYGEPIPVASK